MKISDYFPAIKWLSACVFLGLFLSKIYTPWFYLPILLTMMWIRYEELYKASKKVRFQYLVFFSVVLSCISVLLILNGV